MDPFTLSILLGLFLFHKKNPAAATGGGTTAIDTATGQPITLTPGTVATSGDGSGTTAGSAGGSPASLLMPPDIGAGSAGSPGVTLTTPDLSTGIGTGAATSAAASQAAAANASPGAGAPQAATLTPAGTILPAVAPGQKAKAKSAPRLPRDASPTGVFRTAKGLPVYLYTSKSTGYWAVWGTPGRNPPHHITAPLARSILKLKRI